MFFPTFNIRLTRKRIFKCLAVGLVVSAVVLYVTDSIATAALAAAHLHRSSIHLLRQLCDTLFTSDPKELSADDFSRIRYEQSLAQNPSYFVHDSRPGGRGCSMPYFTAYEEESEQFYVHLDRRQRPCPPALTASDAYSGAVWMLPFDRRSVSLYFSVVSSKVLLTASMVVCVVVPMERKTDVSNELKWSEAQQLRYGKEGSVRVASGVQFGRVECELRGGVVVSKHKVEEYHFFVNGGFEDDVNEGRQNSTSRPPTNANSDYRPNIIVLGVDSVSHINLKRQMPYLNLVLKHKDALEMFGYNKIGDNTYPNMMAALTGLDSDAGELAAACLPEGINSTYDACTFIWNVFAELKPVSYRTAFAEDMGEMGVFNAYGRKGFIKAPADRMLRPMILEMERYQAGRGKLGNAYQCLGAKRPIDVLLAYAKATRRANMKQSKRPIFGWFWTAAQTHDYFNQPQLVDKDIGQLVTEFTTRGNSFVVVMSDHGLRWGGYRKTYQGMIEERQPFLYLVPPGGFSTRFSEAYANLIRNRRRLITPFDLYETLRDLAEPSVMLNSVTVRQRAERLAMSDPQPRGISLFLPVPEGRNCAQAGVAPHWCMCQERRVISRTDSRVQRAARFVVEQVNQKLRKHKHCMQLSLHSILDATEDSASGDILGSVSANQSMEACSDVRVQLRTKPGLTEFEGTVRMMVKATKLGDTVKIHTIDGGEINMAGPISRTNEYGRQSDCVSDENIKLYCFCDSFM